MCRGVPKPFFFVGSPQSMLGICPVLRAVLFGSFLGAHKVPKIGVPKWTKKGTKERERERESERERERESESERERERVRERERAGLRQLRAREPYP